METAKTDEVSHLRVDESHLLQVQLACIEIKEVLAAPEASPVSLDGGGLGAKVGLVMRRVACSKRC